MSINRLKQQFLLAVFIGAALLECSISLHHGLPISGKKHQESGRKRSTPPQYPFRTTFLQTGESVPCAELEWSVDTATNLVEFRLRTAVIRGNMGKEEEEPAVVGEWVAFGMSANGTLIDADLIVFYSHRNRIHFKVGIVFF